MGSGMSMFNVLNPGMSCGPHNNPLTARRFHKIDSTTIDAVSPKNLLKDHADYKEKSESSASKKDAAADNSKIDHDKAKETEEVKLQVEKNTHNSLEKYDSDDQEEEHGRSSDFEGYMYMKSPSFRHFCVGYHSDDSVHSRFKRTATIGKIDGTKNEKKIQVEEDPSIICTGEVCMRREPGTSSTEVNKTRRRRRRTASFGRAFGHKPPGYKNLMKVKDYYTSKPKKTHGDLNPSQ